MPSSVIYIKDEEKFVDALSSELKLLFKSGERIAIKLHMGEPGSTTHLQPALVKKVVDCLTGLGCTAFLFDSTVSYNSPRNSEAGYCRAATEKGFAALAPLVISDRSHTVKGRLMDYEICSELTEADGVLVLSHVKGHICTGFGGAIKNLGMGAVPKQTKRAMHDGGKPVYGTGCTFCEQCAKNCPTGNIRYDSKGPRFDKSWCCGCSTCIQVCPVHANKPQVAEFDKLLSEAAALALKGFKKHYCINVLQSMTELCDCCSDAGPIMLDDIGILLSHDIVAIEKASHDLIVKKAGKDIFLERHHTSPLVHIKEMEKLGLGSMEYTLNGDL